jgi:1-aminocyclopropane-1-carboxylate deaminase/D-cysteine desulfhydrase-like pyridoxal-dependent ACC family enzyme
VRELLADRALSGPRPTLAQYFPELGSGIHCCPLGDFPTPVERLQALEAELGAAPLYVKRDDLSSPLYGGNKVRTLEVLFGVARAGGARAIAASGAFGSNHAVATVLHASRAGLEPGAILFPQPHSWAALENLRVSLVHARFLDVLPHWSFLPFALFRDRSRERAVMLPGGATPDGALGYVAAAFELAEQVASGALEAPRWVVVGIGSTCTTAGLLVGFAHAARLGVGFRTPPRVLAVRVTPWPVTSRFRILGLAVRASQRLAELARSPDLALTRAELSPLLELDGSALGPGYGRPSAPGLAAIELFRRHQLFALDTTYSSKAFAGYANLAARLREGPLVWWSTKSTAKLPDVTPAELEAAPAIARRWIARAEQDLRRRGELPAGYPAAV